MAGLPNFTIAKTKEEPPKDGSESSTVDIINRNQRFRHALVRAVGLLHHFLGFKKILTYIYVCACVRRKKGRPQGEEETREIAMLRRSDAQK